MKNTTYSIFWIITHGACNYNNSFNFWIFSKFQVEVQRKLAKLHFLSLSQIPKMVVLKVRIKVHQGASTFWMCGPLGIKIKPHLKCNFYLLNRQSYS